MPHFDEIKVERPSFLQFGNSDWHCKNLNEITVIFGKNGAGKSTLLRTINKKFDSNSLYIPPERTGEFTSDINKSTQQLDPRKRNRGRTQNFDNQYREYSTSRIYSLFLKIADKAVDGELPNIRRGDIEEMLGSLLPDFTFKIGKLDDPLKIYRSDETQLGNVNQLSSGEAQLIALAIDLLSICYLWQLEENTKKLILFDEPDLHLHPDLQQHLSRFLVKLTTQFDVQFIIASHSTTLLSSLGFHGKKMVSIIYLDNSKIDQNAREYDDILQKLTTCLGGHALMGPMFAAPLLLVEGDDDYQIWSQVHRHPSNKNLFSVIPCDGDKISKYRKTLEIIFKSILNPNKGPYGFVLRDGDKKKKSETGALVEIVYLEAHESENLYLTDEILGFIGLTWEEAKRAIKEKADDHGMKSEFLKSCDDWDRKTVDLKGYITEIAYAIDSKSVPWTIRVGNGIGKAKPSGQLEEFLGLSVMNAFWD